MLSERARARRRPHFRWPTRVDERWQVRLAPRRGAVLSERAKKQA